MTSRAARINMIRAGVRLSGHVAELTDVSLTGALMTLDTAVAVGSRHVLRMVVGTHILELDARVVRVKALVHQHPPRWEVGVTYIDVTPDARRAIPAIVAKLTAALDPRPRRPRGFDG